MEMLIVVAIIAVLIAIAIPVFMGQLENSRESTDAANLRSAYAEVMAAALTGTETDTVSESGGVYSRNVDATQQEANWQNNGLTGGTIGGLTIGDSNGEVNAKTSGSSWTVSFNTSSNTASIS